MAIDLDKIPQPLRGKLIHLGEQYGSQDTLDQANQTLAAYKTHADALKGSGFAPQHAKELEAARDGLANAGVGRQNARGRKKVTGKAYVDAMNRAQSARMNARAVLMGVKEDLEGSAELDAPAVERDVEAVLKQTRAAPDKAEPLAQQLAQLAGMLKSEAVMAAAAEQGGAEALAAAEAAIAELRKADQEDVGGRGTPVETETLDLLDGIIVRHVRRARRAAEAAARRLGNPALVEAFKLDKLYRSRAGGPPAEEPGEELPGEGEQK
ncbi:hypothetical protein [Polyangium aurulentum]|uniref:hypothetical protein n=1 Tax=Polyangium aurulentum TaxID=2567896 RepID=UPI0010AE5C02|nr:hypothetical protein [Polyangium aurulentum]UQA58644.1 hypothetical protein E8A73_046655 [Polyangium aurulentum]